MVLRAESLAYFLPTTAGPTPPGLRVLLPVCHQLTLAVIGSADFRLKYNRFAVKLGNSIASGTNLMSAILFFPVLAPLWGLRAGSSLSHRALPYANACRPLAFSSSAFFNSRHFMNSGTNLSLIKRIKVRTIFLKCEATQPAAELNLKYFF